MKRKRSEQGDIEDDKQKRKKSNVLKKVKERQRRSRISESISELKKLVPSCSHHKKLNQSLIMSMSVDYIQFLQKKVLRLETENEMLKKGVPVDEESLPYVPDVPESTFTEYQKSKEDHELEVDIEMGRTEFVNLHEDQSSQVNGYQEYAPVGEVSVVNSGSQYDDTKNNNNRNRNQNTVSNSMGMSFGDLFKWGENESTTSSYPNTVGGMLSQIPSMYMNGEKIPVATGLDMNGTFANSNTDSINNSLFPALEQHDGIGLPLFRDGSQQNYRSMRNIQEKKQYSMNNMKRQENQQQHQHQQQPQHQHQHQHQFNSIDTYPSMVFPSITNIQGDIEDFGSWPLHPDLTRPHEVRNNQSQMVNFFQ